MVQYGMVGQDREYYKLEDRNATLIAAAPETAAERDRLREVNAELVRAGISLALEARHLVNTKHGGEFLLDRVKNMESAIRKA